MLRKRKGSEYFWYRFRFNGRTYEASTKLTNRQEAEKVERAARLRLIQEANGTAPAPVRQAVPTFAEFAATWLDGYRIAGERSGRLNTYLYYQNALKKLLPAFGSKKLTDVTGGQIQAYVREQMDTARSKAGRPLQNRTINIDLKTLRAIFNAANACEEYGEIKNPTRNVKLLPVAEKMRIPTADELSRYFAELSGDAHDIAKVIALQGLRPHEVCGLRVKDVCFVTNLILVAHKERNAVNMVLGKTKSSERELYMRREVRELLARRVQGLAGEREALLFPPLRDGAPMRNIDGAHARAIKRAGIAPAFVVYDLRHYFATDALARGTDVGTLSKLMGHTDIRTTMKYVHPMAAAKRAAMIALDGGQDAGLLPAPQFVALRAAVGGELPEALSSPPPVAPADTEAPADTVAEVA